MDVSALSPWMVPPPGNLLKIFWQADAVAGKGFVVLLLMASVYCWSVMVAKGRELRTALEQSKRFQELYRQQESPLSLFLSHTPAPSCPLSSIYQGACKAMAQEVESRSDAAQGQAAASALRLNPYQVTAVRNAAERSIADEALKLEEKMGWLATAANTAPLLGLLGTIWGVMETFSSMGEQGNASIAAVAPGISSALLTTFFALIVAIPSAVGYNRLTERCRTLAVQMDNFADELMSDVQRAYMRDDR